jgi:hypothetical protein
MRIENCDQGHTCIVRIGRAMGKVYEAIERGRLR